jgi:hypothetical protein
MAFVEGHAGSGQADAGLLDGAYPQP